MEKKNVLFVRHLKRNYLRLLLALVLAGVVGCSSSSNDPAPAQPLSGVFIDSPVSGLTYETPSFRRITDANGAFRYHAGETVTFSIGALILGSAVGDTELSPIDLFEGADAMDQRVVNMCVLLQTIDADGDLNNGIQITDAIAGIVSDHAPLIAFDQTTAAFAADPRVAELMTALNDAEVFSDTDPRQRRLRGATAAREHLQRSLGDRVTISTTYGDLRGIGPNADTWAWYGVPYAKPPLEALRWRPPQYPDAWTGVRDAVAWGDQAAQIPAYEAFGEGGMSEDCLYLNITAPRDAENLPVMVWFHGGGFTILTGNTKPFNNPESLPTKDVVLVTVNHRLGALGYLAHPRLSAESGYGGSGNYGQMDLILALEWVQENIAYFGGNPDNVTIFGESGGGGKVISLMASEMASGLFHKGISQSGMAEEADDRLNVRPLADAEQMGLDLAAQLGAETLEEMRAKTWLEIIAATGVLYPGEQTRMYSTNIDHYYATKMLFESIQDGLPNDVPLISGANTGDMPGLIVGLIEQMPLRSDYNSAPQYVYVFKHVPSNWRDEGVLAYHGIELVYVFNYPGSFMTHFLLGLTEIEPGVTDFAARMALWPQYPTGYGAQDLIVTENMMTMWTNFAKTGDPSTAEFSWTPYTRANDTFAEIGTGLEQKTGLAAAFP